MVWCLEGVVSGGVWCGVVMCGRIRGITMTASTLTLTRYLYISLNPNPNPLPLDQSET